MQLNPKVHFVHIKKLIYLIASSPSTASGQSGYPPPMAFHRVNGNPKIMFPTTMLPSMSYPL